MAETQPELKMDVASKLPERERSDNWLRRYAVETGQRPNSGRARIAGAERLRRAADKRVGKNSAKLADLLTKKALAGDVVSAKMLIALAEAKKPDPPKKRRGPTLAQWLAVQPQQEPEVMKEESPGVWAFVKGPGSCG